MIDFDEEELEGAIVLNPETPAVVSTRFEESDHVADRVAEDEYDCGCYRSPALKEKGEAYKPLPPVGELPLTFQPGRLIIIKGLVKPHAIRLSVAFTCGSSDESDLAFHLHPHFEESMVIRNYRIDNRWGIEETTSSKRFPYKRNEDFHMQIFSTYDNFLVAFDGEHYCGFTYRIPLKRIKFVQVYGDVDMVQINHQDTDRYPILYDGMKMQKYIIYSKRGLSFYNAELSTAPLTAQLGEGLSEGSEIEISGKVKLLPFTFHINLQGGTQIWPHPTVALHINPRFLADEKSQVIQNACIKGKWGKEEKTTISRFRPGTSFSMKIACQRGRYAISLDGKPSYFFIQRCAPELVTTVYIHGDVWIKDIQYTRNVKFQKQSNVYGRLETQKLTSPYN